MKRLIIPTVAAAFVLSVSAPALAVPFTYMFDLLPAGGAVAAPAGSTVGWGYELTNDSATHWLYFTAVTSDSLFLNGTALSLFDFPILMPGQSVSLPFDEAAIEGLYQLTWDAGAPNGFVNSGNFTVTAQFYDGDPLAGGTPTGAPLDESAAYSATVTPSAPEPVTALLFAAGVGAWARRRTRQQA